MDNQLQVKTGRYVQLVYRPLRFSPGPPIRVDASFAEPGYDLRVMPIHLQH